MAGISRRQLLKQGTGGAVALAALSAGAPSAHAQGRSARGVHIHGVVDSQPPLPPFQLAISIEVFGRPDDLAGSGWDSGTGGTGGMVPSAGPAGAGPVGACYYTAAGSLDDRVVTLRGRSLFTNRPLTFPDAGDPGRSDTRADGREMNCTADVDTGDITWSLGNEAFTAHFAGTGVVTVIHGSRASKP